MKRFNFFQHCCFQDKFFLVFLLSITKVHAYQWYTVYVLQNLSHFLHVAKWTLMKGAVLYCKGTKNSVDCTLILTEGDSAKTLAVSGLAVVGRDRYGVFPLRGKVLNVREATHKQVWLIDNILHFLLVGFFRPWYTQPTLQRDSTHHDGVCSLNCLNKNRSMHCWSQSVVYCCFTTTQGPADSAIASSYRTSHIHSS